MKTFLIAAVAVAVSGAAFAKDLKGSVMNDAEMDKVTAGSAEPTPGLGTVTAGGGCVLGSDCFPGVANGHSSVPSQGLGICQTGASGHC